MNITNNRLPAPAELPVVEAQEAEAVAFYQGWWAGLAVGAVIGAGISISFFA